MKTRILQNGLAMLFCIPPLQNAGAMFSPYALITITNPTSAGQGCTVVGDEQHIVVTNPAGNRFYRLFKP